jgi:hypothetical protein
VKPVAIDLFCGKGGWTNGLLEAGFEVYGFDIETQPDYKGIFVQCDILALTADDLLRYGASFATCSSPCEQFSVHGMKHFHPSPKYPDMGIKLFNHSRALLEELDIPYVMENVGPARNFVGPSTTHCGPFYLWGTGVPAVFPPECYRVTKSLEVGSSQAIKGMNAEDRKAYRKQFPILQQGSKSPERKAVTAAAAMIPLPIARAVAETAWNLTQALEVA